MPFTCLSIKLFCDQNTIKTQQTDTRILVLQLTLWYNNEKGTYVYNKSETFYFYFYFVILIRLYNLHNFTILKKWKCNILNWKRFEKAMFWLFLFFVFSVVFFQFAIIIIQKCSLILSMIYVHRKILNSLKKIKLSFFFFLILVFLELNYIIRIPHFVCRIACFQFFLRTWLEICCCYWAGKLVC